MSAMVYGSDDRPQASIIEFGQGPMLNQDLDSEDNRITPEGAD